MKIIIIFTLIAAVYCNALVIGKAGVGKSYLINALLGQTLARESATDDIGTTNIQRYEYSGFTITDTPGLFDIDSDPEIALRQYIIESQPMILIVCYDASERRLSSQDKQLVEIIKKAAGNIMDKTIFVLTQINRACMGIPSETCREIIASKYNTLQDYGAQNIIISGDKHDCLYELSKDLCSPWMTTAWEKIILTVRQNPYSIKTIAQVAKIYSNINNELPGGQAFRESASNSGGGGCISVDSLLGGKRAGDLVAGDIIEQNGKQVKVLFVYIHRNPMFMHEFTIGNKTVALTGNHYLPVNESYIQAQYAKIGDYIIDIQIKYGKAMYIVTELEDLYIDNIPVSTYVWNYWIMRILHIPFRWILSRIY